MKRLKTKPAKTQKLKTQKGLRPQKLLSRPIEPFEPMETIEQRVTIRLDDTGPTSLATMLKDISLSVGLDQIFVETDWDGVNLYYVVTEPNVNYAAEMKRYVAAKTRFDAAQTAWRAQQDELSLARSNEQIELLEQELTLRKKKLHADMKKMAMK